MMYMVWNLAEIDKGGWRFWNWRHQTEMNVMGKWLEIYIDSLEIDMDL